MATYGGNINIATNNSFAFLNSSSNDIVLYTSNYTQNILIGTSLLISSNFINVNNASLGINNSNPLYTLDIIGDINLTGNIKQNNSNYNGYLWSNLGSNLFVYNNVGINNSNPLNPLDINGSFNITNPILQNGSVYNATQWSNQGSNVWVYSNVGINKTAISNALDVAGDVNFTGLLLQNGTPYVANQWSPLGSNLYVLETNIGIGTSNPNYTLDIVGNLNVSNNLIMGGVLNMQGFNLLSNTQNALTTGSTSVYGVSNDSFGLNLIVNGTDNFISNSNLVGIVNNLGYIGINNSNPLYSIDVIGDINCSGVIRQNAIQITSNQWGSNYIFCNVGINTSNPLSALDVVGDVTIRSNLTILGYLNLSNIQYESSNIIVLDSTIINSNLTVYNNSTFCNNLFVYGNTTVASDILPLSNITYNIGSDTLRFNSIFLNSNTIDMGNIKLTTDPITNGLLIMDSNNSNTTLTVQQIQIGNVLIGLDSNNNIQFTNTTTSCNISITNNGWNTNGSNVYTISNVAIGKSNPLFELDLAGTLNASNIFLNGVAISNQIIPSGTIYAVESNNLSILNINSGMSTLYSRNVFNPNQIMFIDSFGIDNALGTAIDSNNNIYFSGNYNSSNVIIYNSNNSNSGLFLSNYGSFMTQFNSNGVANWCVAISGINNATCIDSNLNLITVGTYSNIASVYNPNMTLNINIASLISSSNAGYIVKYNSNGIALWNNSITNAFVNACSTDSNTNIIITGASTSNSLIYDTNSNTNKTSSFLSAYANVSTVAGTGTATFLDSSNLLAGFNYPRGICMDSNGNIYIADTSNNRIRKINGGIVTTIAGSGTATYLDGTGTNAGFNYPRDLCLDSNGNIYIADTLNNRIRKITSGIVTTFAGNGTATFLDGSNLLSGFNGPRGIAFDTIGNLYVSDTLNQRLRMINSNGIVTTFAGSGTATLTNATGTIAAFNYPESICIDNSNIIYIADTSNNVVRKCTTSQVVSTYITCSNLPRGVCVDYSGNVYVSDSNIIRVMNTTGTLCNLAASGTATYFDGTGTNPGFNVPTGLCVDLTGNLYVADSSNNRIRRIETAGTYFVTYGSNASYSDGAGALSGFNNLSGIALDNLGILYVADSSNNRIRKIVNGVVSTFAGTGTATYLDGIGTNASFNNPMGLAIDSSNNLYVSDTSNNRIRKITGNVVTTIAGSGTATVLNGASNIAGFNSPIGICLDSSNNLYVADTNNNIIRMLSNGIVTTFAGTGTATYLDGNSNIAGFKYPCGVIVDTSNNLYCADTSNNRIRKVTAGVVTTLAGSGTATFLDGFGTLSGFNNPYLLTIDINGNLYIADQNNNTLRKINISGFVTTIAGVSALYTFLINSSFTFNNAGAAGYAGPTLAQCQSAYSATSWTQNTQFLNMSTQGIQIWSVPIGGTYTITAAGARSGVGNGEVPGYGRTAQDTFTLATGQKISILCGQVGGNAGYYSGSITSYVGGGGGGTFVCLYPSNSILIITGGGGAGGYFSGAVSPNPSFINGNNALISTGSPPISGTGAATGGGYSASGDINSYGVGGNSFLNGGNGGVINSSALYYTNGGFGGGCSGHYHGGGGGGGYYGGISETGLFSTYSAGGTCYSTGSSLTNIGNNTAMGYVTITRIA